MTKSKFAIRHNIACYDKGGETFDRSFISIGRTALKVNTTL